MTYRGHIEKGLVVFDEPISLPEGTPVQIEVLGKPEEKPIPTLLERLQPIIGQAKGLPPDASINHDHYLYGLPKK